MAKLGVVLMSLVALASCEISTYPDQGACDPMTGPREVSVGDYINTPEYPEPYPDGQYCEWLVTDIVEDSLVMLTFLDFDLEPIFTNCSLDNVTVYDGASDKAPSLGTFCLTALPKPVVATSNQMYIRFRSAADHGEGIHTGFLALVQRNEEDAACNATPVVVVPGDTITSPNFPLAYPNDALCEWRATVSAGVATLEFLHFALEPEMPLCQYDAVEVYDGPTSDYPLIGRFCATVIPEPVVASGHDLFIRFRSDLDIAALGFQALIKETPVDACDPESGPQPLRHGDIFSSPNFPDNYPNLSHCEWTARVENGVAVLTFVDFAVEDSPACTRDAVEVFDGPDSTYPLLGYYCGYTRPDQLVASSNFMFIRFLSDADITYAGFEAIITDREVSTETFVPL